MLVAAYQQVIHIINKMEFNPENIANINKDPLMRESDRGCVLIRSSDIENLLTQILEDYINETSDLSNNDKKLLFDFTGPLGTFSSKILLTKALGLLDSDLYEDISTVRVLRNRAAHSDSDFSLSEKDNIALVESMKFNNEKIKGIKRYSLKVEEGEIDESEGDEKIDESIAKGYGLIRHDKSRFILITSNMKIELTMLAQVSKMIAQNIPKMKKDFIKVFNKYLEDNKEIKK